MRVELGAGVALTISGVQMTSYFMTIPEAVQLVLQASTLGSHGDIYMLDMGDPVKITDLARKLITMSGLTPFKDVEVKFVGNRGGEKIHEQLWKQGASIEETQFPRVFKILAESVPVNFTGEVSTLQELAASHREKEVLEALRALPINFTSERRAQAASAAR